MSVFVKIMLQLMLFMLPSMALASPSPLSGLDGFWVVVYIILFLCLVIGLLISIFLFIRSLIRGSKDHNKSE